MQIIALINQKGGVSKINGAFNMTLLSLAARPN